MNKKLDTVNFHALNCYTLMSKHKASQYAQKRIDSYKNIMILFSAIRNNIHFWKVRRIIYINK